MIGDVRLSAQLENSRETQPWVIDFNTYGIDGSRPVSPNMSGIATVNPASTSRWANAATFGVMPGISLITTTPGPGPGAVHAFESCRRDVNSVVVKPSSAVGMAGD